MIETDRLILRPHRLDDYEASYALLADPDVVRLLGAKPISREDAWHRLMRYAGHWSLLGWGLFAVFEKDGGRFVGETGLADFHRGLGPDFDPFPEAAWVLAVAAQGKGYAQEATTAAHRWFDEHHAPARTVCIINPVNIASVKLGTKLGYRPFGTAPYRDTNVTMYERLPEAG